MNLVRLPQAMADLVETADYIAADDPEVADRFFNAFEMSYKCTSGLRAYPFYPGDIIL